MREQSISRKGWNFGSCVMFDNVEDCWEYTKELARKRRRYVSRTQKPGKRSKT
mgnify:CR=1 FL=1